MFLRAKSWICGYEACVYLPESLDMWLCSMCLPTRKLEYVAVQHVFTCQKVWICGCAVIVYLTESLDMWLLPESLDMWLCSMCLPARKLEYVAVQHVFTCQKA